MVGVKSGRVRMLGYGSKEELLKRQVPEIFVDRTERKTLKDAVDRQPMIQGQEITLIRKDGTSIVCLNTAAAVRDNGGRRLRLQGAPPEHHQRPGIERPPHQ